MAIDLSDQETVVFRRLIENNVLTNNAWKKLFPIIVSKGISTVSSLADTDEESINGFTEIPEIPRNKLKEFRKNIINIKLKINESFSVPLGTNDLFKQFQFIPQLNIESYLKDFPITDKSNQINTALRYVREVRENDPHSMPSTDQQATLITLYCQEPAVDRSNSFYALMNRNLRERNPNIISYQSALYVLDSAIRSLPSLPRDTVAWRGVSYAPDLRKFYVGNTVCFTGICSASLHKDTTVTFMEIEPETGEHKRTLFKLFVINGKSINLWSPLKHEREVITNFCSRWKVLKVEPNREEDFSPSIPSYYCDYYIELEEIDGEILFPESIPDNSLSGLSLLVKVDHQSIGDHFQAEFRDFFTLLHNNRAEKILEEVLDGYWDSDRRQFFDVTDTNEAKDKLQNFFEGLASLHTRFLERSIDIENALKICEEKKIYSWVELQGSNARKRTLSDLEQLGFSSVDASKIHQETKEDQVLHNLYGELGLSGDLDNPDFQSDFKTKKQLVHYVAREGGAISLYRIAQSLTDGLQVALRTDLSSTILRIPGRFGFKLQRADICIASVTLAVQVSSYALRLWYGDITVRQFVKKSVIGLITVSAGLVGALLAAILCPPAGIAGVSAGIVTFVAGAVLGVSFSTAAHSISRWALNKLFPDGEEEEINAARKTYYQALASLDCLPSNTISEIRRRYHELALQTHPDKHPDDIEGATERFQQLVAAYALIQGYHQVLGDACKDLNFDVNNITYDKVEQWRNLHKNILSKSTKECDGKTFRVRKSFRIVLRHTYYSNQTSLRRLRRFLDDDRHKTIRKEKPTPKVPVTHNNSS